MISERALGLAVERSVITAEQAAGLRAVAAEVATAPSEPVDEEALRFVTGFADIFVTIGIVLFLGALAFIMDSATFSTPMYAGLAGCAWLLAEFFTFKRRMALPSIVLLVTFVGAVLMLSLQVFAAFLPPTRPIPALFWLPSADGFAPMAVAAIVAAAMAAFHYLHFRVPITVAVGTAALALLVVAVVVGLVPGITELEINVVVLLCGLAIFALAMRFDMSDPERATRRTDIAFWLHLLAAPLIVHPLIRGFLHGLDGRLTTGAAVGILWLFLALGVLAVIIDRRAILVSGLVYAGIAYGSLIKAFGLATNDYLLAIVLLTLGAFILLVSAGWQPLRRALLRRLPLSVSRRLPHPLVTSQA